ncbi:MAG: FAD-dependent oxidoreductase [Candidatus Omnitrophota bacterium]
MAKNKIIILGAGLAGLSAAWHIQKKKKDCLIFEQENQVGGLCRSRNTNGFIFDYCGHLLHFRHRYAFRMVKGLLGRGLLEHRRSAWVYSHKRYTPYPFQANLYGLPASVIKECLLGLMDNRRTPLKNKRYRLTFWDWINTKFGKGIARNFMVPYNEKFWTVSPRRLTCEWLDGFIPVPTLNNIIEGVVAKNRQEFGYNTRFWYPEESGIMKLPLALARGIKNIYTGCAVSGIDLHKKEIRLANGTRERFDYLISTIPLPEANFLIKEMPDKVRKAFGRLRWNSIFNLNLGIKDKACLDRHWVYFPEKEFCFFRTGFYHNFSPNLAPGNKGSVYVEVAYSKYKPIDKKRISRQVEAGLIKCGIISGGAEDNICAEEANDIHYGYPIYDRHYSSARQEVLKYLISRCMLPCGRYGSWSYMSMEDAILDGRRAAEIF